MTAVEPLATTTVDLPDEAWLLGLATLGAMTPARLTALVARRTARAAFSEVLAGRARSGPAASLLGRQAVEVSRKWAAEARRVDVAALWVRHRSAGVEVAGRGSPAYPDCFVEDPHPPALVTWRGQVAALERPRVAVVGTRDCSLYGYEAAKVLGRDLAAAGVAVVSGLALGIDCAAHSGALDAGGAPPVGVVGAGLDVVYPRRNARLWAEVATHGLLLSEQPLGTQVAPWQFPARNRLIAAMADVLVVVESHARGGALITAHEALRRGRSVMAVPGPLGSASSEGANDLLADGAGVCRGASDVLTLLQLDSAAQARASACRPAPGPLGRRVLDAMGPVPVTMEQLMVRTGDDLAELAARLDVLEEQGWVSMRGGWYEILGSGAARDRS